MAETLPTAPSDRRILVCDQCLRACCWYGEFMCGDAQGAGTGTLTTAQLHRLSREHPDYWSPATFTKIYGKPIVEFSESEPDLTPAYLRAIGEAEAA